MKNVFEVTMVLVVVLSVLGCGSTVNKTTKLEISPNSVQWTSNGFSLAPNGDGPQRMAAAQVAVEDAKTRREIAKAFVQETGGGTGSTGKTGNVSGRYWLGLQNNDASHRVYVYHPEMSKFKVWAEPNGGFAPFSVKDIPLKIHVYDASNKIIQTFQPLYDPLFREKISHKKSMDGGQVDLVFQIDKVL